MLRVPGSGQRHFGLAHQIIDRGARFVRQVGGKLPEAREGILQAVQHAVERGAEVVELLRGSTRSCNWLALMRRAVAAISRSGRIPLRGITPESRVPEMSAVQLPFPESAGQRHAI